MSVTIGGLVYNGAEGTPYPVVPTASLEAWATAAEAYRYSGQPRKDGGQITAWLDCTETNAQRRLAEAGGQIGYVISVVYPHGTIAGLTVASVDGEWQARRGAVNGGILVVRIRFDYEEDKNSGDLDKSLVWCETATALAGPWTKQATWACMGQQDGLGTYAGDAEASAVNELPDPTMVGKYVRLVLREAYPGTKTVVWVGAIMGCSANGRRDPANGVGWGSKANYQFAGIASVLARLYPTEWMGTLQGGEDFGGPAGSDTTQVICGFHDFNEGGGKDRGTALVQVDDAPQPTVYLHGTGMGPLGSRWNAGQALRTFLAITRELTDCFPIKLDTSYDALLAYEETWAIEGRSVLDFIAQVLTPAVKRTFRLDVTTGEAGTAGSGYVSIVPIDIEATGVEVDASTTATEWEAGIDGTQTCDRWFLDMGPREVIATVDFEEGTGEDGTKGWTGADETTWDGRSGEGRLDSKILAVWRRYVMRRGWLMATAKSAQIQNVRELSAGEETGELDGTEPPPDGVYGWRISRTLPFGAGADFSGASDRNVTPQSPVTGPMVWYVKGTTYEVAHEDLQVQIESAMAGLTLGRGGADQDAIKAKLADDFVIRSTVSFVHYLHWRASRLATATQPRTDAPRIGISYLSPMMRRTDIINNTVVGLTNATTEVLAAGGRKDNGPEIGDLADSFKRWQLTDSGSLQWSVPSVDVLTPLPGVIVAQVKVIASAGPPPVTGTLALGGIPIAQRRVSWDAFAPGVTWTANRIMPSLSVGGKGAVVAQAGNVPRGASPGGKILVKDGNPNRGR